MIYKTSDNSALQAYWERFNAHDLPWPVFEDQWDEARRHDWRCWMFGNGVALSRRKLALAWLKYRLPRWLGGCGRLKVDAPIAK